jgi:hypothetical protein
MAGGSFSGYKVFSHYRKNFENQEVFSLYRKNLTQGKIRAILGK